jgi:hypothetical protein
MPLLGTNAKCHHVGFAAVIGRQADIEQAALGKLD